LRAAGTSPPERSPGLAGLAPPCYSWGMTPIPPAPPGRPPPPHVLVIDDERDVRAALRAILERSGYAVSEAADGAAGLLLQRERPADVVLCDMYMPNKDGREALQEFRRGAAVPVVVMSGGSGGLPALGRVDVLGMAGLLGAAGTSEPQRLKILAQKQPE